MTTQKEPTLLYPGEYVLLSRDWVMWRANQLCVENPKKPELWAIHTAAREGVDLITKDYTKEEKEKFITPICFAGAKYYIFSSDWKKVEDHGKK